MDKNIGLDTPRKLLQIETTNFNNQYNNIIINSQISQTNPFSSARDSTIKSSHNYNINNLNLLQSPKNIYKNFIYEEKNISGNNQSEDNTAKIVRRYL